MTARILTAADTWQRNHAAAAVPVAVLKKFGDDRASSLAALMRGSAARYRRAGAARGRGPGRTSARCQHTGLLLDVPNPIRHHSIGMRPWRLRAVIVVSSHHNHTQLPEAEMLIALLAVLGVNLGVLVVLLAFVLLRRRWVAHQPGAFKGAIRVAGGEISGLGPKWRRGYGRWVRDVLVWTKAPFLFRNELVAIESLDGRRAAGPDEIKRLGDHPVITRLRTGNATLDLAARDADVELLLGPYQESPATVMAAQEEPMHQS